MNLFLTVALLCVMGQHSVIDAKRILLIANVPSYSHQISYRALCLELNKRGHEIVAVTPNPIRNSSLANYTEIDLQNLYNPAKYKELPYNSLTAASLYLPFLDVERFLWDAAIIMNREVFMHPEMKKLYAADSNEHFDAVIVAQGYSPILNAFAYRFKAPLIGVSSLDVFNQMRFMFGGLILPSHISNWQTNWLGKENMSFWERLVNFCEVWRQIYHWMNVRVSSQNAFVKKHLGEDMPSISDITKNMSVYLVHKNPMISIPRQEQPNVVFYHGVHIAATPPAIPNKLKQLLDETSGGFIYVSFGTNVRWEHLPKKTFETFLEAFASLPWKILWKNNPNMMPKKFNNIFVSEWFLQQGVLAHPNIKLFIYQGGLQSTEEAIHYGVPLIGCPVAWDQKYQIHHIKRLGIGTSLDYTNLTKEIIVNAVHKVINDKRYKERAQEASKIYKDTPYDSLQNAVWWIEYVMRHNGTRLQDTIGDEPWYQRYDWDIIGFLAVAAFTASVIFLYTLLQILRFICEYYRVCRDLRRYTKPKSQ